MKKIIAIISIIFLFPHLSSAKIEIGANFGAPAFFNAALGYWPNKFGLRLSGMYFDQSNNGCQFNLIYKYFDDGKVNRSWGIALASSQDVGCDWSYLGPVYNYTNEHFFLELGIAKPIAVRRGDFSKIFIFPIFQIGYMYWL